MNKKVMLLIPVLIGIMFVLPLMSAAVTLNNPVTKGNYTDITFNCTKLINDAPINTTNVTLWYNATGGTVGTMLASSKINNDTTNDLSFYLSGISVSSLSDLTTYNFSCKADNGTSQVWSAGVGSVTIDNTSPVTTLGLDSTNIYTRDSITIQWTATDATSGLSSVVTTITSPDSSRCPTLTYTDTNGKYALSDDKTVCPGVYTVLVTATDRAGNIDTTSTKTFKVTLAGLSKSGSNTLGGSSKSEFTQGSEISNNNLPLGENGTNIVILILILGSLWYFFKKK